MSLALAQARLAAERGEVPVGAVAVADGGIVAQGHNRVIGDSDPSAHAEIVCLREAAYRIGNYRLTGLHLFVTLEPCAMCYGAMVHARISRVVFGAYDEKSGVLGGATDIAQLPIFNHRPQISGGMLADESTVLLRSFFKERRSA